MATYDIADDWDEIELNSQARIINEASDDKLEKWASDPDCKQRLICATALNKRSRAVSGPVPFDARTEVSADARYVAGRVVKHLWIIFVTVPFIVGIIYELLHSK